MLLRRPLPPGNSQQKDDKTKRPTRQTRRHSPGVISTTDSRSSPRSGIRPPTRKTEYRGEFGDIATPQPYRIQPRKPRGPDRFPGRVSPRTFLPNMTLAVALTHEDRTPCPPPLFTLNDFQETAARANYQWRRLGGQRAPGAAVLSRQNYKKLTGWFETHVPSQREIHSQVLEGDTPEIVPRKPKHQALLGKK